jgi:MFS family permease
VTAAVITETIDPPRPVKPAFIAALTLAQVGAFLSFTPLLAILAPLKAAEIDPGQKAAILAQVSFWGAVVAGVANIGVGVLSDRTLSRFGRRRPWLLIGLIGTVASYFVIMRAHTAVDLLGGALLFQLCLNLLFGPLVAMLPDQVPHAQKGRVSAFLGLAPPAGAIAGVSVAGLLLPDEATRYGMIALLLVVSTLPLLAIARDPPTGAGVLRLAPGRLQALDFRRAFGRDFTYAWISRLLMQLAVTVFTLFALFNIQDRVHIPAGWTPEGFLSLMIVAASLVQVATSLVGGFLSDRWGRRKPFVLTAGLLLAVATLLMALGADWRVVVCAFAIFGAGFGLYTTVDIALVTQVLTSRRDAGRDLGLINLANTIPQMLAPLLGLWLVGALGVYAALYLVAAVAAAAGGGLVLGVRSVR